MTNEEMISIDSFKLVEKYGMFHSIKNPNGMVRDHIISRWCAYINNYDPYLISHPANCHFITNLENLKKGSDSWMTIEELKTRVESWDKNRTIENINLIKEIIKTPKSINHINNIRESIKNMYRKKFENSNGTTNSIYHSNSINWKDINQDIRNGLKSREIVQKYNITNDQLRYAKGLGLVVKVKKKPN